MKSTRSILALTCCALLVFSLTSALAEDIQTTTARFSPQDMMVSYVYAGASMDDALAVFGTPENSEAVESAATGDTQERLYYTGLTLTFSGERKLIAAAVDNAAYLGPRGVAVGQTVQDVAAKFYLDMNSASNTVLYTAGYVEELDAQLPRCGYVVVFDDGGYSLIYAAPAEPFGADLLADPTNFIYEELALFTVTFDAAGTVTGFNWNLGPWAE